MNWNVFLKYKGHHVLLWLAYFVMWFVVYMDYYTSYITLILVISAYFLAHAGMYYITQYRLIPIVLRRKNIFLFALSFIGLGVFFAFILLWVMKIILGPTMAEYFGGNNWILITSFFFSNMFMGGLLIGAKSVIDRIRQQRKNDQMKQEQLLSELSYLKAQVNPHFLFNTINSVFVLIKMDPDKAAETLIKLSDLLRAQLYDFSTDLIRIEDEIQYLENYIALEKIRMGHRVKVEILKEGELNGFRLPPLLLMPFLENCFKHLSSFHDQKNIIKVKLHRDGSTLSATFINTFERDNHTKQPGGIGLVNVRRRLELLYGDRYSLDMEERDQEFEVQLKINIHE